MLRLDANDYSESLQDELGESVDELEVSSKLSKKVPASREISPPIPQPGPKSQEAASGAAVASPRAVHFPDEGATRVTRSLGLTVAKEAAERDPRHNTSDESNGYGSEDFEELDEELEELDETSPSIAKERVNEQVPALKGVSQPSSRNASRGIPTAPESSKPNAPIATSPLSATDDSYGSQSFAQPSRSVASAGTEGYSEVLLWMFISF